MSGGRNYHAGRAAEDQVAALYGREGHIVLSRRWRGAAGEIDLVLEKEGEIVFVEVKASASFAQAALHLTQRQIRRLYCSAADALGQFSLGQLTPARFDVALVDRFGRIDRIENAIGI